MRFQSYFNTAISIISLYDGSAPLQYFLKQYFSLHKKHGSTDRKVITHLCYNFYRLGKAFDEISIEEKLKAAIFICNDKVNEWVFLFDEEWLNNSHNNLEQRIAFVQSKYNFKLHDIFPFVNDVSEGIDTNAFIKSFLIQPDVFIRIRNGFKQQVINKLQQRSIPVNIVDEDCIALPPSVKIDNIINIDEEAVVQDYSSQQVGRFLRIIETEFSNQTSKIKHQKSVWDCCAGSGGKSILAYDVLKNIQLTVSDVRSSIIQNLKQRFAKAGIKNYKSFVADITGASFQAQKFKRQIAGEGFDVIICDAPCTGSGTWGRTPEQLYFFQPQKIDHYASLQKNIVSNAIEYLKPGSYFLYITCSVFSKENEAVVELIKNNFNLRLIEATLLKGYHQKADTMFAALFKNI